MGKETAVMLLKIMAVNSIRDVLELNIESDKIFEKVEQIVVSVGEIEEALGIRKTLEQIEAEIEQEQENGK